MNNDEKEKGFTEQFMSKCKRTINIIEYVLLSFYIVYNIYTMCRYSEISIQFILISIIQILILYFIFYGIKKGYKHLALLILIISLIDLILDIPVYILVGAYVLSGISMLPLRFVLSLLLQLFSIISMIYILLSKNIKVYCDYLRYDPSK